MLQGDLRLLNIGQSITFGDFKNKLPRFNLIFRLLCISRQLRVVDIALPVDLKTIKKRNYTSYILDADIQGFFDHIDHEWAVKFVESRIKDPNIIRLLRRMLKAGIMKDYTYEETEEGYKTYVSVIAEEIQLLKVADTEDKKDKKYNKGGKR